MSKWKKIVLASLGTVFLGAIGSGVWDMVGKRSLQWFGQTLLTIATLGSSTIKDQVYREAAKGHHEASSLALFALVCLIPICMLGGLVGWLAGERISRAGLNDWKLELERLSDEEKLPFLEGEVRRTKQDLEKSKRTTLLIATAWVIIVAVIFQIRYLKIDQANQACTYFNQSLAICSPYLDERQRLMYESKFAAIGGREDYMVVIADLRSVAKVSNRKLPDYKPW